MYTLDIHLSAEPGDNGKQAGTRKRFSWRGVTGLLPPNQQRGFSARRRRAVELHLRAAGAGAGAEYVLAYHEHHTSKTHLLTSKGLADVEDWGLLLQDLIESAIVKSRTKRALQLHLAHMNNELASKIEELSDSDLLAVVIIVVDAAIRNRKGVAPYSASPALAVLQQLAPWWPWPGSMAGEQQQEGQQLLTAQQQGAQGAPQQAAGQQQQAVPGERGAGILNQGRQPDAPLGAVEARVRQDPPLGAQQQAAQQAGVQYMHPRHMTAAQRLQVLAAAVAHHSYHDCKGKLVL